MNKFEKSVSYEEGAELIRRMKEAQAQGKGVEHIGFEVDPSTGEYVKIKNAVTEKPKVIQPEIATSEIKPEIKPEFKLESEPLQPIVKPEDKKKTAEMRTAKSDSKLIKIPKKPSLGSAEAMKRWQDENDK